MGGLNLIMHVKSLARIMVIVIKGEKSTVLQFRIFMNSYTGLSSYHAVQYLTKMFCKSI